jgi:phosphonate transport system substrate-binding protein
MTNFFTISPDFSPDHLSGWYIFNTWLQKITNEPIRLVFYDNFELQRQAIENDCVDLIYANPFDAAMLVREKGFKSLVRPDGYSDEAIIAVHTNSNLKEVADLKSGISVATTDDPDIFMMGMILLEPAELDKSNIELLACENYILVAKQLIRGSANVGIFFAEAYDDLSNMVKKQLRILVRSQIDIIHHSLMIGPRLQKKQRLFQKVLTEMSNNEKGKAVLASLGFQQWQIVNEEAMEFMIDLMDTLSS